MSEPFILEALPPWSPPKVAVLGIGHAGIRALNAILQAPVRGVDSIAVAGDEVALTHSLAPVHLHLDTAWGPAHKAALHETLADTELVFLIGSVSEPYSRTLLSLIARLAKAHDGLTIAVVSTFYPGEPFQNMRQVEAGLHTVRPYVDALIPLSVQRVWQITERLPHGHEAMCAIDTAICQTIQGIADLVTQIGLVCLDLMDLRMLFRSSGWATMGSGMASGAEAAMVAAQQALASPWLDVSSLPEVRSVLVNITGGTDLSVTAIHEATTAIYERVPQDTWKIFGAVVDEQMGDNIRVTVVAVGLHMLTLC
jgi:cell division protein FtsZ